jgi:hypothetical protein
MYRPVAHEQAAFPHLDKPGDIRVLSLGAGCDEMWVETGPKRIEVRHELMTTECVSTRY